MNWRRSREYILHYINHYNYQRKVNYGRFRLFYSTNNRSVDKNKFMTQDNQAFIDLDNLKKR